MPKQTLDKCNGCGSMRGADNYWWMLMPAAGGGVTVQHLDGELLGPNTEIYCGEHCLLRRISEIISVTHCPDSAAA